MTITDPPTTPDALALLRALDEGDDSALPILADLLEEQGDPRAAGLRLAVANQFAPAPGLGHCRINRKEDPIGRHGHAAPETFERLASGDLYEITDRSRTAWREYPTRSAAFLAFAEALADG